jgi:hypothetical protein
MKKNQKTLCPSLSKAACAYLQERLTSARLSSVLADLEEDRRMASWAYGLLRRRHLFPGALPDVLGTLNTQHRAIDWASLQAAAEQAPHVSGTLV